MKECYGIPLYLPHFNVSKERGYLPTHDPLARLPEQFNWLNDALANMPRHLAAGTWGPVFEKLPTFDARTFRNSELECAHRLCSCALSGYVWEHWQENKARTSIRAEFAVPYVALSKIVGRPPILAYVSYALNNWRRIDPLGPIALGNIELLQYFLGKRDEAWFTLVHIEIEAHGGQAINAAIRAQESALLETSDQCERFLAELQKALVLINAAFARMPEECDPGTYFKFVRPWINGWKTDLEHSPVRHGIVYEGVAEFGGKPQRFRGETGAQSSIAPLLDAALGITHEPDILSEHLNEMRDYMPRGHRELIATVEKRKSMRAFVQKHPHLHDRFNACILELWGFRAKHLEYASGYINKQARTPGHGTNPTHVGTGGTPFMTSLKKHLDETLAAKV